MSAVTHFGLGKLGLAAAESLADTHKTARAISNCVAYFTTALTTLVFLLLVLLAHDKPLSDMNETDIQHLSRKLVAFAFGISTAAIATKISSVVYGKAAESAMPLAGQMLPDLPRNQANPVVVSRAAG